MTPVIAFGELLYDCFPTGRKIGGAPLNFAWHMAAHGFPVRFCSAVGRDADGGALLREVAALGLATSDIGRSEAYPSGRVTVTLTPGGGHAFAIGTPAAWDDIPVPETLAAEAEKASAVCWGTLALRTPANRDRCFALVRRARRARKIFDVNLRQEFYSRELLHEALGLCTVLKLSDEELPVLRGFFSLPADDRGALAALSRDYAIPEILYTLGAAGAIGLADGVFYEQPCIDAGPVADTVGCGDAFTAGWAAARLKGADFPTALEHAARVAGYVAAVRGAIPPACGSLYGRSFSTAAGSASS